MQWAIVAAIVAVSALSAGWTLMPAGLRRALATAALRLSPPAAIATWLRRHAASDGSCACSGCDRNPLADSDTKKPTVTVRPITVHRRTPG